MRELDRIPTPLPSCAIVGAGRLGTALAAALRATGLEIDGPLGRGAAPAGVDAVLLCVPDAEIAAPRPARRGGRARLGAAVRSPARPRAARRPRAAAAHRARRCSPATRRSACTR